MCDVYAVNTIQPVKRRKSYHFHDLDDPEGHAN
jgi:hypothetical protein